jgi:radical SAM family uncharacterized protein
LYLVEKPARYVGGELNSCHKLDPDLFRIALAYPDLYEIGMSNLGLSILYHRLNEEPALYCQRVYAPAADMERLLRAKGLSLWTLEEHAPLGGMDLIGFSLQYEMTYTQILNMLDLGGIPLYTQERQSTDPVIVAGGPGTANPEPMAPFFDAMLIGDGEEAILDIARTVKEWKREPSRDRGELHRSLARIPGLYVPSLYHVGVDANGLLQEVKAIGGAPWPVISRKVTDLDRAFFPTKPIVPGLEIVHDRAQVELFRGCLRGCRFCQAGMIYRPQRIRSANTLFLQAEAILSNTGWEELGLISLSTCDYPDLSGLLEQLQPLQKRLRVTVSLPSLRADSFSVKLARLAQGNKITLTFAPEAGSERLRTVIGKDIRDQELVEAVRMAADAGFQRVKLYFMVGLPRETQKDLEDILPLVEKLRAEARHARRRLRFSTAISAFVPKAHTAFQWEAMEDLERIRQKRSFLRQQLERIGIETGGQREELSVLEGVLARGDRRLAAAIREAWRGGSRLDGWSDFFSNAVWQEAFVRAEIDPRAYLRAREREEILPWSVVRYPTGPAYLWRERERAYAE